MALDLKMNIGEKKVTYPSKTTINFIHDETRKNNRTALIVFAVFLLLLGIFVKFMVIDPLNRVAEAERAYNLMDAQLDTYRKELVNYNEVQSEYNDLVGSYLTEDELSYQDRTKILDMIAKDVSAYVNVRSISISGNTIRVATATTTMSKVSEIVQVLLNDSRNSYVTVKTTQTDSKNTDIVEADLVIVFSGVSINE